MRTPHRICLLVDVPNTLQAKTPGSKKLASIQHAFDVEEDIADLARNISASVAERKDSEKVH